MEALLSLNQEVPKKSRVCSKCSRCIEREGLRGVMRAYPYTSIDLLQLLHKEHQNITVKPEAIVMLMSAFNIGFREINFGRWLRLLPRTEYDLKAKGWARSVAGFQSLISVYLIALWVLTYFGRPFEQ